MLNLFVTGPLFNQTASLSFGYLKRCLWHDYISIFIKEFLLALGLSVLTDNLELII